MALPSPEVEHLHEDWPSLLEKATLLGTKIQNHILKNPEQRVTRLVYIPRGGLVVADVLSRMLALDGSQVVSMGLTRYDRENPTVPGAITFGQMPSRDLIAGHHVLIADEVHDTGITMQAAYRAITGLGALTTKTAAIHYKPGMNQTAVVPDFYACETDAWVHYPNELADQSGAQFAERFAAMQVTPPPTEVAQ